MKIGVIYPQTELGGDPAAVRQIGLAAEALGYDHLLAYDHVLGASHDRERKPAGPYTERHPFHDPFVMFAYLAGQTTRLGFATGVLVLPQRQTALVARQAADLDLLSGQRFRLGVGIGWNHVEYQALGQAFASRGARLEEQVGLLRELWRGDLVNFEGRFDAIDKAALNPAPARQVPLWLGGFADAALRRAARIADGFIFSDVDGEAIAMAVRLKEMVMEAGRGAEEFGLQLNMSRARTPEGVVETARLWAEIGGGHAAVSTMGQGFATAQAHVEHMTRVAEAIAAADLG